MTSLLPFSFRLSLLFFFLMIRRPPRSTLFHYPDALPISVSHDGKRRLHQAQPERVRCPCEHECRPPTSADSRYRSEEHTSELQSHLNLVCRLLLEKKKNRHSQ